MRKINGQKFQIIFGFKSLSLIRSETNIRHHSGSVQTSQCQFNSNDGHEVQALTAIEITQKLHLKLISTWQGCQTYD